MTGETFGSEPFLVRIGNHVTITAGVRFVTHDGGVWVFRADLPDIDVFNPIRVGNNVFIGIGSILLPGTHIGDNCIIGAGSIVTGVIPSNAVAAGVPARVIKTVDQYWESVVPRAMHIRSLSPEHKRSILLRQFGIARSEEAAAPNKEAQPALR
jgi:tetrahydrodipicolinate N-succinyltransferase